MFYLKYGPPLAQVSVIDRFENCKAAHQADNILAPKVSRNLGAAMVIFAVAVYLISGFHDIGTP